MISLLIIIFAVLMGAAVGALFSLGFIKAYRQGIKDGRAIKEEAPLEPLAQPRLKEEKPDTAFADQLNAMAGFQAQFSEERK